MTHLIKNLKPQKTSEDHLQITYERERLRNLSLESAFPLRF